VAPWVRVHRDNCRNLVGDGPHSGLESAHELLPTATDVASRVGGFVD
jgi:hypothetical protein